MITALITFLIFALVIYLVYYVAGLFFSGLPLQIVGIILGLIVLLKGLGIFGVALPGL